MATFRDQWLGNWCADAGSRELERNRHRIPLWNEVKLFYQELQELQKCPAAWLLFLRSNEELVDRLSLELTDLEPFESVNARMLGSYQDRQTAMHEMQLAVGSYMRCLIRLRDSLNPFRDCFAAISKPPLTGSW